ncbi:MAG: ATP-binding protein [Fibrobacterota bacterium]
MKTDTQFCSFLPRSPLKRSVLLVSVYILFDSIMRHIIMSTDFLPPSLNNLSYFPLLLFPLITNRRTTIIALFMKSTIAMTFICRGYFSTPSPTVQALYLNGMVSTVVVPFFLLLVLEVLFRGINRINRINASLAESRKRAEAARAAKADFLANMSHEIRTPISGIIGLSQMIISENHDDKTRNNMLHILDASQNLLGIVNNILDYSKIDSGQSPLEYENITIRPFMEKIVFSLHQTIGDKPVKIESSITDDVPAGIRTDRMKLRQILTNLISNAVKYTPRGRVTVKCSIVEKNVDTLTLCFAVSDTGVGMDTKDLQIIFDEFTQVDDHYTKLQQGTGLGLAITKKLLALFDSEIHVESTKGTGSTFSFNLTAETASSELQKENLRRQQLYDCALTLSPPHLTAKRRILLAEDNRVNQIYIQHFLKKNNMEPIIADNGRMALDYFRKEQFDLILMDIQMPVMSGIDATMAIRRFEAELNRCPVPIFGISASVNSIDRELYLKSGITAVYAKPLDLKKLIADISELN